MLLVCRFPTAVILMCPCINLGTCSSMCVPINLLHAAGFITTCTEFYRITPKCNVVCVDRRLTHQLRGARCTPGAGRQTPSRRVRILFLSSAIRAVQMLCILKVMHEKGNQDLLSTKLTGHGVDLVWLVLHWSCTSCHGRTGQQFACRVTQDHEGWNAVLQYVCKLTMTPDTTK